MSGTSSTQIWGKNRKKTSTRGAQGPPFPSIWPWSVLSGVLHYSGSISAKSNHLPSSPTSITHAPPSKDVGRISSTPFKQHGRRLCLPLPSPSALPRHSMSSLLPRFAPALPSAMSVDVEHRGRLPQSATAFAPSTLPHHLTLTIEDASPGSPLPFSLPHHLTLSVKDVSPTCHCPRTLRFATSPNVEHWGHLWFATALLSATSSHI